MTDEELLTLYRPVYDYLNGYGIFEVRNLARAFGVKTPTYGRKHDLILRLIAVASGEVPAGLRSKKGARVKAEDAPEECVARVRELVVECNARRNYDLSGAAANEVYFRDSGKARRPYGDGDDLLRGVLEAGESGGFLRALGCEEGEDDPVVPESMIKKFGLRNGDALTGYAERIEGVHVLVQLEAINGVAKSKQQRAAFESFPAIYPVRKLSLGAGGDLVLRAVDLLCPIGRGQRGLVFAPCGTDASAFLRAVASATADLSDLDLCYISVGCGPEEETELRTRFPRAHIVASPLGKPASHCVRMVRLAIAHCKRIAESGGDVLVLLDSLPALARAFGETLPSAGRRAAGGTDLNVLNECENLFAAARKLQGAGSVTLLAAAPEGGSAAAEDVLGKCLPAANARLRLAADVQRSSGCPALDLSLSHTRRADLLLKEEEAACSRALRTALPRIGTEGVLRALAAAEDNARFLQQKELWGDGRE